MLVATHDLERVWWIGRGRGKAPLREKEENKIWSLKFRERKTK